MPKCYMCVKEAITVEHAPPRCIFPEQKDLPAGMNLRKNLITVPSCEDHNTAKSKDDEYLLYVLSSSITNNQTGLGQFLTKVRRAYSKNPSLINAITKNPVPVTVKDNTTGTINSTVALEIDRPRITSCLEKTARALFNKETKETFEGEVTIIPGFLMDMQDAKFNEESEHLVKATESLTEACPEKGENPEAFTYKMLVDKQNGSVVEMKFYGETKAYALMKHTQPG